MDSTQHPFDAIARSNVTQVTKEQPPPPEGTCSEVHDVSENMNQEPAAAGNLTVRSSPSVLHALKLSGLNSPAIILDSSLRVIWQNKAAIDCIWCRSRKANNGNPTPDIFDLLFDQQFRHQVDNWRQWVKFFTSHIIHYISAQKLESRLEKMNGRQKDVMSSIVTAQTSESGKRKPASGYLRQVRLDGGIFRFLVTTIDFSEGRLFVFDPIEVQKDSPKLAHSHDIQRRYDIVRSHPNPVRVEFCVFSANLNKAMTLKTALLPEEFCRLVNDICKVCIDIIEAYGGYFLKHSDSALSAYFLRLDEHDHDATVNTIRCALALKNRMAEFSRELKLRRSWRHDLELNMGIHHDNGYMGILSSSIGDSLTSFGDAMHIAAGLARLSQNGEIWVSKPLIAGIAESSRTELRFGIHRADSHQTQALVQNSFAKVRDLPGADRLTADFFGELEDIAVTQVFDIGVQGEL